MLGWWHAAYFFIHGSFKAPDLFVSALGTSRFGTANLTITAFPKRIFFRDRREILTSHLVNSVKVSDEARVNRRHLLLVIGDWSGAGGGSSDLILWIPAYGYLKLAYTRGAVTLGRSWIHTISPRELERFWWIRKALTGSRWVSWLLSAGWCSAYWTYSIGLSGGRYN